MKELYETCARLLTGGEDVVTATIISQSGSAPRAAGGKMLVRADGSFGGTIGGGLLEAEVLQTAGEVFRTGRAVVREFNLTGADAASTNMICGGRLEVLVGLLSAGDPDNAHICRSIGELLHSRQQGVLLTKLPDPGGDPHPLEQSLLLRDGRQTGFAIPAAWRDDLVQARGLRVACRYGGPENVLVEPVNSLGTVYIFGAGHVSQKLAVLTSLVDFRTVVLDDRAEFAKRERFPMAEEIIVPESMEDCFDDLSIREDSYVVIVTRGHQHDLTVLSQAIQTDACYIGMIGSARKRQAVYQGLRESGISEERLARVHSPIGLKIGAETPEEIAVSIVAQLIQVRGELLHGQA
ncbi:MAG TPA: XdhC family protein [Spirochaetia bacterium]|nr:XdhC family protein [Spirochaetia bacterium]